MKQTLKTIILIIPILMAVNTFGQHKQTDSGWTMPEWLTGGDEKSRD